MKIRVMTADDYVAVKALWMTIKGFGIRSIDDSRLLPCPSYCKPCCSEHWGTCVSFSFGFLGVYAQQWDYWVIWQFCFQYF